MFADCRTGLVVDENGYVIGLDDRFMDDFSELIRLAYAADIYLVPVLFDFLMGANRTVEIDAVTGEEFEIYGRVDLIRDPDKRESLMDNAVAPLLDEFGDSDRIVAWDLFNEPEWLVVNTPGYIEIALEDRPDNIASGGVVSLETMNDFFAAILNRYPQKPGYDHRFTIGSASGRWVDAWDVGVDMAQFHLWNDAGQIDAGRGLDELPGPWDGIPTVVGEFDVHSGVSGDSRGGSLARIRGRVAVGIQGERRRGAAGLGRQVPRGPLSNHQRVMTR